MGFLYGVSQLIDDQGELAFEDFDSDSHIGDQTPTLQDRTKSIEKSGLRAKFLELSIFLFSGKCQLKDPLVSPIMALVF